MPGVEWLSQNASTITAFGTLGMLIVWIVYAHVFYKNLRRQHRPRIIIDCMSGPGTDSVCVMTNLSTEVIYLQCVIAAAISDSGETAAAVAEGGLIEPSQAEREIVSRMRQGPVASGELITLGTIEDLARQAASRAQDPDGAVATLRTLEVRVIATMSAEDEPIGARKRFNLSLEDGQQALSSESLGTIQMTSRRDKRRVLRWLDQR